MVTKIEKKDGSATLFMKSDEAMSKFEDLMVFQYGPREESDLAFNRLTEDPRPEPIDKKSICTNECVLEPSCKGVWQEECSGPVLPGTPEAKKYEVHDK